MIKSLALLLLSSIVMPATLDVASTSFNRASEVENVRIENEEQDTLHGYTYTDHLSPENGELYRTYDTDELTPEAIRYFNAPSGFVFKLGPERWQIEEMLDQMIYFDANFSFLEVMVGYKLAGATVTIYRTLMPGYAPGTTVEEIKEMTVDILMSDFSKTQLFKTENAASEFTITPVIDIRYSRTSGLPRTHLIFNGKPVYTKPFDASDFISVNVGYSRVDFTMTGHMALSVVTKNDFFYEYPNYNEYGWHTSNTLPLNDEDFIADFTFSIYAMDDVPIALDLAPRRMVEITIPQSDMPVKGVIKFTSGGEEYVIESKTKILKDPETSMLIDGYVGRSAVERGTEHEFGVFLNNFDYDNISKVVIDSKLLPYRLTDNDKGHDLYENPVLPEEGIDGHYYYVPTSEEIALYNEGKLDELNASPAEGQYYLYLGDHFEPYEGEIISDGTYDPEEGIGTDIDPLDLLSKDLSIPFNGRWNITIDETDIQTPEEHHHIDNYIQSLDVFSKGSTEDAIILNVPDNTNLVLGGRDIDIIPTITTASGQVGDYYFEHEIDRTGVVNLTEGENGKLTIEPIHSGLVNLTISVESSLFPRMSKRITIRVLDSIYDVAKIEVPDTFHKAGQNIDVAINARGFTNFQNIDVKWKVTDKKGKELPAEKIEKHDDATMTLLAPDTGDYTITASIDDIKLQSVTVQVRYVDMNKFLRVNIWWIFVITIGFVVLVLFLLSLTKRSKSTVDRIERVYQVYCQCISNDALSEQELKRIRREILKCLHHCEDLNIDAFNQYEKATRYLRKSLMDVKLLQAKYNEMTPEEKGVIYENLNRDLGKALNVAKEIETAKAMIEQRHLEANRRNYESLEPEKKGKKK